MKKKVALLLALIMVFALFAAGCGSSDDGEGAEGDYAGTVKIGVFEPASGDNGAGGKRSACSMRTRYSRPLTSTEKLIRLSW